MEMIMLRREREHRNITLSFPQELIQALHFYVEKRGMSRFVQEAVVEKLHALEHSLEQQCIAAAQDAERNKTFQEWEGLSGDGLNETNKW